MKIPEKRLSKEEVLKRLDEYSAGDLNWRSGKTFGYVYDAGRDAEDVAVEAASRFLSDNALDPTSFPSLLKMENDIVSMAISHLGGGDEAVGNFTSGGTESCLLAVKTARDWARKHKPEVTKPQMILPTTVHAAFHKGAAYFGVDVIEVPVDPKTFRVDVSKVQELITDDTILIVGSAPSYAHGVVDPIAELGRIADERGILMHVDACIGGWLLPYYRRLGDSIPAFDLSVKGVTSISMDLHKYGYAPKGASVILYRDKDIRRHQIFGCATWTGYSVVNATMQGTKSGGPLAAAWAVLHYLGDEGYLDLAKQVRDTTHKIIAGVESNEDLRVLGRPEMSLVAFASDTVDVFHVVDEMKLRGWYVQPQLAFGGSPKNIHLTVAPGNATHVEALLGDLSDSVDAAKKLPESQLVGALAQMEGLNGSDMGPEVFSQMLSMAGAEGGSLPERLFEINSVLDMLPPAVTEKLLIEFFNELYATP